MSGMIKVDGQPSNHRFGLLSKQSMAFMPVWPYDKQNKKAQLSLTILAYLHSFSYCYVRNLRNPEKFTKNSNLWSSRSSKVIDLGVNGKPVYDFILVINNNFSRICYGWMEQCFTSPPTQYRLYRRRFLQVKRPNQQHQSTEGRHTLHK